MPSTSYKRVVKYLSSLESFRNNFTFTVSLSICASLLGLLYPVLFKNIVGSFNERNMAGFLTFVGALLGVQLVQTSISVWTSLTRRRFDLFANGPVIMNFYEKVQSLPMAVFKKFMHTGEIYQRVIDSLELNRVVADAVTRIALVALRLLVLIGVIFWLDPVAGLLVLGMMAIYATMHRYITPRARRYQQATLLSNSPLTNALFDGLNKIRTIKALGARQQVMDGLKDKLQDNIDHQLRYLKFSAKVGLINGNLTHILKGSLMVYAASTAMIGRTELSSGLALMFLIQQVFEPMQSFVEMFVDGSRALIILERYYAVLGEPSECLENESARPLELTEACPVTLENVSFSYGSNQVLRNVNLHIPAGKRVALVGRSGAGKSTIMNLVLGLYRPQEGRVLVDGVDLADVDLTRFRKQVGVVLQEEYIFPGTLRENVTFGLQRRVDDQAVIEALRAAELWDRFAGTPDGLQTVLQDGALSGGELQRLILARAFLRNPALLVFDEPTSSMDMETEARIQAAMDVLLKGRTSLTIAHRLSTIMKSDLIYIVEDGQVVEQGTHHELVQTAGFYSTLYRQSLVA
ncbi:MAG TPA: ABC transporter ATP-binding protein [Thermoanaerobaculia bacterium]|nr:ABC transporter ATP-binding protein [Thermoanaerobaculia bacterium]